MKVFLSQVYALAKLQDLLNKEAKVRAEVVRACKELERDDIVVEDPVAEERFRLESLRIENEALKQRVGSLEYDLEQAKRDVAYWCNTNTDAQATVRSLQTTVAALKADGVLCEHDRAPSVCSSCKWIKTPEFSEVEIKAMKGCRKIEAIKEFRTRTGVGLKEAKNVIDAHYDLYQTKTQTTGGP